MSNGIQKLFAQVPRTYERVNHILTFGMDILWRRKAVRLAVADGGQRWIDVCSGTGETAVYLTKNAQNGTRVYAADFSLPMLQVARSKPQGSKIRFSISEIKALPFSEATFDLITISFATRNINTSRDDLLNSFKEFHRVLKPGGRFVNLETSQPNNAVIRKLYHSYIKLLVKPVGWRISGAKAPYAYLSHTIPRFYPAAELAEILKEAGFSKVDVTPLMFGVAAIHKAVK
jgi:demethylmenaquinone methyltransferase / 2-methoxy-6-polyprenyl-1,4-benzoquinol methylase